jgi:hypothetical protein
VKLRNSWNFALLGDFQTDVRKATQLRVEFRGETLQQAAKSRKVVTDKRL